MPTKPFPVNEKQGKIDKITAICYRKPMVIFSTKLVREDGHGPCVEIYVSEIPGLFNSDVYILAIAKENEPPRIEVETQDRAEALNAATNAIKTFAMEGYHEAMSHDLSEVTGDVCK